MLKGIRGALGSVLASGLMILLLISFAIWGVGDIFRQRTLTIAEVGESEITLESFIRDFNNRVRSLRTQYGDLTDAEAIGFGLHQQVLSDRVTRSVLDEDAKMLGLRANNNQVRDEIRKIEAFEGLLGGFDQLAYVESLRRAGYGSEQEFEELVRGDMTRNQLIQSLTAAKPIPRFFVDTLYVHRKETRTADILTIPASTIKGIGNPDEETLRSFHETLAMRFMTPEYRTFSYLFLETSDFAADLEITEELLREEYEDRLDDYQIPDTRTIEAVHFQDEDVARAFQARIAAGEDFQAVATEMTDFTAEELKLGEYDLFRLGIEYTEVAADRVFKLGIGETAEPVNSIYGGWDVFRVTAIKLGSVETFEQVRSELMTEVVGDRGTDALYDLAGRIDDELATSKTLEEVAEELGLQLYQVSEVDRNGVGIDGLPTVSRSLSKVLSPAFLAIEDDDIMLEESEDGVFFAVELASVTSAKPKTFEEVRDALRTEWINEERLKIARARADEALTRAEAGESFVSMALSYEGATFPAPALQRDNQRGQGGISLAVSGLIFSLPNGGVGMEQSATGDGYILARVTSITPGVADPDGEEYKNLVLRMQNEFAADAAGLYQGAAYIAIEPWINTELLASTFTVDGISLPATNAVIQ